MKTGWLLVLAWFLPGWVSGHEVDSQDLGVTIYRDVRISDGHRGYSYWVENENDYPVWFAVALIEKNNVHDGLVSGQIYLFADQTQYLGTVMQKNPRKEFRWQYRWEVTPAGRESAQDAVGERG